MAKDCRCFPGGSKDNDLRAVDILRRCIVPPEPGKLEVRLCTEVLVDVNIP